MSDHIPTPSQGEDRVRDTLTALRSDGDRVGLHDAGTVRRRGQARTRHQIVAGLAAAVVVVVVAVGGSAAMSGHTTAKPQLPAATPSASPLALAAVPFLLDGDVKQVGPYESFRHGQDPVPEDQRPLQCIPSPTTLGATESKGQLSFSDTDATFIEHVLRFADASAAQESVSRLSSAFASCDKGDPNEATVADHGPERSAGVEGVTETLHASRLTTPKTAGEVHYYELGIARVRNVVVVLEWSSMGKPTGIKAPWVWSDFLLTMAAHRATG